MADGVGTNEIGVMKMERQIVSDIAIHLDFEEVEHWKAFFKSSGIKPIHIRNGAYKNRTYKVNLTVHLNDVPKIRDFVRKYKTNSIP